MSFIYMCTNTKIPNFIKVGRTSRNINIRLKGLNSCGVYGFWIIHKIWEVSSIYVNNTETSIHASLSQYLAKDSPGKESYEMLPKICEEIIQIHIDSDVSSKEIKNVNVYKYKGISVFGQ